MRTEHLGHTIRPGIPGDKLGSYSPAFLPEDLVSLLPLPGVQPSVEPGRAVFRFGRQVSADSSSDRTIPLKELLGPLLQRKRRPNFKLHQFPFQMISHRPTTVKVSRAKARLLQGAGHHDVKNKVQRLCPLLRIALRKLGQNKRHLLVDLSVNCLAHSNLLRTVWRRNAMVNPQQRANLLKHRRSKFWSSVMADNDRHCEGPQHSSPYCLHCLFFLQSFARNKNRHSQKLASVRTNVAVPFLALGERPLEVHVDVEPTATVGILSCGSHQLRHRLTSDLPALLTSAAPVLCILGQSWPKRHPPEDSLSSTRIPVTTDG